MTVRHHKKWWRMNVVIQPSSVSELTLQSARLSLDLRRIVDPDPDPDPEWPLADCQWIAGMCKGVVCD